MENQQGVSCVHGDGNSIFSQLLVEVQHGIVSIEVFISFVQSLYGYFRHLALRFLRIHRCVHPEHVNQVCKERFFFQCYYSLIIQ